jgi:hypothetical protein
MKQIPRALGRQRKSRFLTSFGMTTRGVLRKLARLQSSKSRFLTLFGMTRVKSIANQNVKMRLRHFIFVFPLWPT